MKLTMENGRICRDGKPYRILAGEMHYFRIPRIYWRDRLLKLKACGLNTVSTYMPWNLHERRQGTFDFRGMLDIGAYMGLAAELGLNVILRPGPYICSEWEFGGFPAWLLAIPGLRLRCSEPQYLANCRRYLSAVMEQVRPFFGKNLIAVQIENGFCSYGTDLAYLETLRDMIRQTGYSGIIITCDGDYDTRTTPLPVAGTWATIMGGRQDMVPWLELAQKHQPGKEQFIMEYWNGQGFHEGKALIQQNPAIIADRLRKILEWGAHINLYMFHGGTNFGFMNGAQRSLSGDYSQMSTSYDTCAPLSENGDTTELYYLYRKLFAEFNPDFNPDSTPVPPNLPKAAYGTVEATEAAMLVDNLDVLSGKAVHGLYPISLEGVGGDYGMVRYTSVVPPQTLTPLPVSLHKYQDRGWAFFNGQKVGSFDRKGALFQIDASHGGKLDIVIVNTGRTNYGCALEDSRKGITGGVIFNNQQYHHGWDTAAMPCEELSCLDFKPLQDGLSEAPAFYRAVFSIEDEPQDTYVEFPGSSKGFAVLNGFNLGRYSDLGPVYALYVPKNVLKKGRNTLVFFDEEGVSRPSACFLDHAVYDKNENNK